MTFKQPFKTLPTRSLTALILGLTLVSLSGQALSKDFYKWEDADGVTHYSSQPPKDKKAIKVRATNIRDTASPDSIIEDDSDSTASSEPASTQAAAEEYAKDPERCTAAQQNLKTLQENARIRIKENGEYRYLSQDEISDQFNTAQEIIKQEC